MESARRRGQNRLINSLETYTLAYLKQKASWTSLFEGRELNPIFCDDLGGEMGWGLGERLKRDGTYVCLPLIHVYI